MSRVLTRLAVAAAVALAGTVPVSRPALAEDWSDVDSAVDAQIGGLLQPTGATLTIWHHGQPVHTFSTGTGPAADPDNAIPIYSATKWISATVIMNLVQDGYFALDDTIPSLLPDITFLDPRWDDVTVRMLLAHTSGLAPQLGATGICTGVYLIDLTTCVSVLALEPLLFNPGTAFQYTGIGYQFLGLVAEQATGESWADLVDARLVEPCEMTSLHFDGTQNPWIAGGIITDLADLVRFVELQRTGSCDTTEILTAATRAEMRADQTSGTISVFNPLDDGRTYGLGVFRNDYPDSPNLDVYSHGGAGGTFPWIDTGRDYTAVLFLAANQTNGAAKGLAIYEAVLPLIEAHIDHLG